MRIVVENTDGPVYRVTGEALSVRLEPIHGEEGRFHAFSDSRFVCQACAIQYTRKVGNCCKRCGNPGEPVAYLVDVVENAGRTKCSCESFTCHRRDVVTAEALNPCKHGAAALMLFGHFKAVDAANAMRAKKR